MTRVSRTSCHPGKEDRFINSYDPGVLGFGTRGFPEILSTIFSSATRPFCVLLPLNPTPHSLGMIQSDVLTKVYPLTPDGWPSGCRTIDRNPPEISQYRPLLKNFFMSQCLTLRLAIWGWPFCSWAHVSAPRSKQRRQPMRMRYAFAGRSVPNPTLDDLRAADCLLKPACMREQDSRLAPHARREKGKKSQLRPA